MTLSDEFGAKLVGCRGTTIGQVLKHALTCCTNNKDLEVGRLFASDGAASERIDIDELVLGTIVHTAADGGDLPADLGGPLRVVFPAGVAVQSAICGTHKPVNLKGCVRIELAAQAVSATTELVGTIDSRAANEEPPLPTAVPVPASAASPLLDEEARRKVEKPMAAAAPSVGLIVAVLRIGLYMRLYRGE